jgi:hypothetical protein
MLAMVSCLQNGDSFVTDNIARSGFWYLSVDVSNFEGTFDIGANWVSSDGAFNHSGGGVNLLTCAEKDTDGDTTPDHLDTNSDDDSCSDAYEAGAMTDLTAGADFAFSGVDSNGDGILDAASSYNKSSYGVYALDENRELCLDTDGDGDPDVTDDDDDDDGATDITECPAPVDLINGTGTFNNTPVSHNPVRTPTFGWNFQTVGSCNMQKPTTTTGSGGNIYMASFAPEVVYSPEGEQWVSCVLDEAFSRTVDGLTPGEPVTIGFWNELLYYTATPVLGTEKQFTISLGAETFTETLTADLVPYEWAWKEFTFTPANASETLTISMLDRTIGTNYAPAFDGFVVHAGNKAYRSDTYAEEIFCDNDNNGVSDIKEAISVLIDAVDDDFTGTGLLPGNNTPSIFGNDSAEGITPATDALIDDNLSITDDDGLAGAVLNTDGTITIPAGATSGNYAVTVQLCLTSDNTVCDTSVISIAVLPTMTATDDSLSASPGSNTASVFDNDTADGVSPATDALVDDNLNVTDDGGLTGVTLNTDGTFTIPATAASGDYDVTVQLCLTSDNTVCDISAASITVLPTMTAMDDTLSAAPGNNTTSIFVNDDADGTTPATDALIDDNLSITNDGGLTGVALNTDGTFSIPATAVLGDYTVTTQICLTANNAICDTSVATITVLPTITAGGDVLSGVPGGNTDSVLSNDDADGTTPATDALVETPTISDDGGLAGVSINTDGTITIPATAMAGSYSVDYQVCLTAEPGICDTATVTLTVLQDTDGDGIADDADLDDDNDGIPDTVELATALNGGDTDDDGIPDDKDLDADNDGVNDVIEAGGSDPDFDGMLGMGGITDADADGLDDSVDNIDNAGVGEVTSGTPLPLTNTDGDSLPDFQDKDDDGDGYDTRLEYPDVNGDGDVSDARDLDGDNVPDYLDVDQVKPLQYRVGWDQATGRYKVYVKTSILPEPNNLSMTAQVTLLVPHATGIDRFMVSDLTNSVEGISWNNGSRVDAPTENTSVDYLSFEMSVSQADAINWVVDQEIEVFSFVNSGACLGDVTLIENDTDPFMVYPNSVSTNPGNHFTNLGWGANPNHYDSNYGGPAPCIPISLQAKAMLQGAYRSQEGMMGDELRTAGYIPLSEPYSDKEMLPAGAGGDMTTQAVLDVTGDDAIVDWVVLEIRDAVDDTQVLSARACLIQKDGDIVDIDGISSVKFLNLSQGSYIVSVKHRNHVGAVTASPVLIDQDTVVDFTLPETVVQGSGSQYDNGNMQMLWAGDVNKDERMIAVGTDNDASIIVGQVWLARNNSDFNSNFVVPGYNDADVNLDGLTIYAGNQNEVNFLLGNTILHTGNDTFSYNFVIEGGLYNKSTP